jgi:hypothetical protein
METAAEIVAAAEPTKKDLTLESKSESEKKVIRPAKTKEEAVSVRTVTPVLPSYLLADVKEPAIATHVIDTEIIYKDVNFWYSTLLAINHKAASVPQPCYLCSFDSLLYDLSTSDKKSGKITVKAQIDETMHHYADWAGISYKAILAANRAISRRGMKIGEKVIIPLPGKSAEEFSNERLSHHLGIEEDFFNNYKVTGTDTVRVTTGGQIWAHSLENDIPFWLVMKANQQVKNWNVLRPQQVYIPIIAPVSAL